MAFRFPKLDKTPYNEYYIHTSNRKDRLWTQDYIKVVSIDPATVNLAIRIEKRYKKVSRHPGLIVPKVFDKTNVFEEVMEGSHLINHTFRNIVRFLDQYADQYPTCHYIIVERQMTVNIKCLKICQHILTYFMLKLQDAPLCPSIIEIDPKLKGKVFQFPKGSDPKKEAIEKATQLLTDRGDTWSLQVMHHCFKTKKDDLADTVVQIEAFMLYTGLE